MLKGLYDASAGMKARLAVQDIIASNLANAATSGFQRQIVSIQSHALPMADGGSNPPAATASSTRSPREVLEPVSAPDTRPGVLQQTGVSTDVALDGPGYLVVGTARGNRLIRGGSLHPNRHGDLATLEGDPVLSANGKPIPVGDKSWQVAPDGTVTSGGAALGRLRVVRPGGPVRTEGATLASAARLQDVAAGTVQVRQGVLERSNVDTVSEMVNMIAGVRAYEASQRAVLAQDESLQSLLDIIKQL
jgi:flagellar basal-body rod protein FlgF